MEHSETPSSDSDAEEVPESIKAPPTHISNEYSFLLDRWEDYFDAKIDRPVLLNVNWW